MKMLVRRWIAFALLGLAACGTTAPETRSDPAVEPGLAAIEARTGGRLGVALVDAGGRLLIGHRADELFALCSTFKLPLAAMVLSSGVSQRAPLALAAEDLLPNSPYAQEVLAAGGPARIGFAAQAIVERSDNAAANALLRRFGGPEAFTAWLRRTGDPVTRLDRYELALNENAPGDPRDTTSPVAIARTGAEIVFGEVLIPAHRDQLRRWTIASRTGLSRIRAGLPAAWTAGDKTGSCGSAWNDVGWFETPSRVNYVLAVYLDRPRVGATDAEAAIADVARLIAARVD